MTRYRGRLATAVLAAVALIGVGCQPRNEFAPPPPPTVEVSQPVERPVTDYLEFTGTTQAVMQVGLRARVNGYLEEIHFEDGATVEQDQLLFTIEQAPFRARLQMAEAELAKAKAQLELAEGELGRQRTLLNRNAGSVAEYDIQQAQRDVAAAAVASAEASLTESKLQIAYTQVRAPIAGRIGRHLVDRGNLVQAEQTLLANIESYDPIYAYFTISEGDLLDLRREQAEVGVSAFDADSQEIEMGLGGEDAYPHKGRLDFTDLGVDPGTGTLQLRAIFSNADRTILPGLFARVRTAVGSPQPQLLVPERALGTDQQGDYVLVVTEKKSVEPIDQADSKAHDGTNNAVDAAGTEGQTGPEGQATPQDTYVVEYRSVSLGRLVEGMRVVTKGLKGDEWLVVNGLQRARPGSPVVPDRGQAAGPVATQGRAEDGPAVEGEGPVVGGSAVETGSAAPEAVANTPDSTRPR